MEEFIMVMQGLTPSKYVINVWDCRGWLMHEDERELPPEATWLKCGNFFIPIHKDIELFVTDRLKRKIEAFMYEILKRRGGAINWSGVYRVAVEELMELEEIFTKYTKKIDEIPNISLLFQM